MYSTFRASEDAVPEQHLIYQTYNTHFKPYSPFSQPFSLLETLSEDKKYIPRDLKCSETWSFSAKAEE